MTILVDVDGVLIAGELGGGHWSERLADRFNFTATDLDDSFFGKHWSEIVVGKQPALPLLQQALDEIGAEAGAKEVQDFWFSTDAQKNESVLDWVKTQRRDGHRVLLATNQDHDRAAYIMNVLGLRHYCDGIYYSAALGFAKPDPHFYRAVQMAENKPPEHLILIDDTKENVAAALKEAWRAHHFKHADDLIEIAVS
ncbi:MAG: HAD-IA family hydrolase [Yoonia sp.]